jgi:hypothetical protein
MRVDQWRGSACITEPAGCTNPSRPGIDYHDGVPRYEEGWSYLDPGNTCIDLNCPGENPAVVGWPGDFPRNWNVLLVEGGNPVLGSSTFNWPKTVPSTNEYTRPALGPRAFLRDSLSYGRSHAFVDTLKFGSVPQERIWTVAGPITEMPYLRWRRYYKVASAFPCQARCTVAEGVSVSRGIDSTTSSNFIKTVSIGFNLEVGRELEVGAKGVSAKGSITGGFNFQETTTEQFGSATTIRWASDTTISRSFVPSLSEDIIFIVWTLVDEYSIVTADCQIDQPCDYWSDPRFVETNLTLEHLGRAPFSNVNIFPKN